MVGLSVAAGAPACVTVTVAPAMVTLPVRADGELLDWTTKLTDPFPLPEVAPEKLIQFTVLAALQEHPLTVLIVSEKLPPADGKFVEVAPRE